MLKSAHALAACVSLPTVDLDRLNDDVKRYSCTPRNHSVNLREELKLTNAVFFPRCLLVQRCGGNCGCGTVNWKSCTCSSGKTVKKYHEVCHLQRHAVLICIILSLWLSWEMVPFNMVGQGAEQKAQWLKTLAGLTKDPGKSASYTSSRGSNVPTCIMHIHTCKQNAHTHKVKIMKSVQTDMVSQLFTQSRVWLGAKILRKLST